MVGVFGTGGADDNISSSGGTSRVYFVDVDHARGIETVVHETERPDEANNAQGHRPESTRSVLPDVFELRKAQIIYMRAVAGNYALAIADPTRVPIPTRQVSGVGAVGGSVDNAGALEGLICSFQWDCARATSIFACESVHFRPDVVYGPTVSATNDRGISQTNAIHAWRYTEHGWDYYTDAFDPEKNLIVAHEIYVDGGGFGPWSCSRLT